MRITGTSKSKHKALDGPYAGEILLITKTPPVETMTFKAKGMTGHYTVDGENRAVWIPKTNNTPTK